MNGFWLYLLICDLLIPTVMLVFGIRFGKTNDEISTVGLIVCFVQLALLLCSLPITEQYLKRTFDEHGRRIK